MKFEEINLSESVKRALADYNYVETTLIQEKAIPEIMAGRDVIGLSQTGTGKTAAYSLPILEKVDKDLKKVQALILCPTRELALQVVGEIRKYAKYTENLKSLAVYGGESIEKQILAMKKGVQIVVGTPGRIMDHMKRKTLKLKDVKMVVLDEADEMLNMGFEEDINTILSAIEQERQTVLFSATMNKRILNIAKKYLKEPYEIKIPAKELTVDKIKQISIEMTQAMKDETLSRIIDLNNPQKCVVFCNTKRKVDDLIEVLKRRGYKAESLHGDVKQDQRERIMKKFKTGDYQILIATDVVARGIDVENLELVINYDVPQEEEYYVHRIGRTGRNGRDGKAYTFVVGREKHKLFDIERYAKTRIEPGTIPTDVEMQEIKSNKILARIKETVFAEEYLENRMIDDIYSKLEKSGDSEKITKALLQMAIGKETIINRLNTSLPKEKSSNKNGGRNQQSKEVKMDKSKRAKKNESKTTKGANVSESQNNNGISVKRFFVSLGRIDKVKAKDFVGSITANTNIAGSEIGKIDIMDKFSFVEIPSEYEQNFAKIMNGKTIKGKEVRVELANKK